MNGRWMLYILLIASVALLSFGVNILTSPEGGELGDAVEAGVSAFWPLFIGFMLLIASVGFLIAEFFYKKK